MFEGMIVSFGSVLACTTCGFIYIHTCILVQALHVNHNVLCCWTVVLIHQLVYIQPCIHDSGTLG